MAAAQKAQGKPGAPLLRGIVLRVSIDRLRLCRIYRASDVSVSDNSFMVHRSASAIQSTTHSLSLFLSLPLSTSSLFSARVSSVLLYAPLSSLLFLSIVVPIFFSYITDFVVVGGGFVFATHHRRRAVFYSILLLLQPSPPFRRLFAAASSPRSPFFHSPPLEPIGSSVG